jgi:hypothetical protein
MLRLFEDHGEVLGFWVRKQWQKAELVCFDQHFDVKKISDRNVRRISSCFARGGPMEELLRELPFSDDGRHAYGCDDFLYAAIHLKLVRRIIWVYPKSSRTSPVTPEKLWEVLSIVAGHGKELMNSFHFEDGLASARLLGVELTATTLDYLNPELISSDSKFDIDLDYFGGFPDEERTEELRRVADLLLGRDGSIDDVTLSFSTRSGHLPRHLRYVALEFSRILGEPINKVQTTRKVDWWLSEILCDFATAPKRVSWLTQKGRLREYGGAGLGLHAAIAAKAGELEEAEKSYFEARALGDSARWAAYQIGLAYVQRQDYQSAVLWLTRITDEIVDSIQVLALCMLGICLFRLGLFDKCRKVAERCRSEVPMRREGILLEQLLASRHRVDHSKSLTIASVQALQRAT